MAVAFKVRILDLVAELLAHALVFLCVGKPPVETAVKKEEPVKAAATTAKTTAAKPAAAAKPTTTAKRGRRK